MDAKKWKRRLHDFVGTKSKVLQNMQKAQEVPELNIVERILDKNVLFTCPLLTHP